MCMKAASLLCTQRFKKHLSESLGPCGADMVQCSWSMSKMKKISLEQIGAWIRRSSDTSTAAFLLVENSCHGLVDGHCELSEIQWIYLNDLLSKRENSFITDDLELSGRDHYHHNKRLTTLHNILLAVICITWTCLQASPNQILWVLRSLWDVFRG